LHASNVQKKGYLVNCVEVFNLVFDCVYLMICRLIVDLGSRRKRFAQKVEEWRELQKKVILVYIFHTQHA